jgi:putative ATP-dependent endonuclease of OLD family
MARVKKLTISGYRSIGKKVSINFPKGKPLVLVGENNTGKSNIVKTLDLVLGELWPGSWEPEDHDFWGRVKGNIEIAIELEGFEDYNGDTLQGFRLSYDENRDESKGSKICFTVLGGQSYVKKELREKCICIYVAADRRLSYQLSYASKWTLLSKLMRKFHISLTSNEKRTQELREQFERLKGIFREVTEFAEFEKELKQQCAELLEGFPYSLGIDFSAYDPSRYFQSLRVLPMEGEEPRNFDELGTGQEQVLALAFANAYAKAFHEESDIILVIEEPEAHLHPQAQMWLAQKINEMAEQEGLQIVITTHSPYFLDIENLEGIVLVRKDNEGSTIVKQLTVNAFFEFCKQHGASDKANVENILKFYKAHATPEILEGLFARKAVLVEGLTEALSLPIYLKKVGLDIAKKGIAIIPVGGKKNLAKWWRFFRAYDMPVFVIFDNDGAKDDKDAKGREDILKTIGIGDFARYINETEWKIFKERHLCIFGKNFEGSLAQTFEQTYIDLWDEARNFLANDSKPLIARYIAEKIPEDSSLHWEKFEELKEAIEEMN